MNRMMMCFKETSGIDPMDMVVKSRVQFGCENIAIRVHDGTKDVAMLNRADEYLPKVLQHADGRDLGVYFYVDIKGSDTATEAKQVIARIKLYNNHPSFRGLLVHVTDGYAVRSANSVKVYFDAIEAAFPKMELGVIDTTTKKMVFMPDFLKRVDFSCVLIAGSNSADPWKDCQQMYRNYITWYGMSQYSTYKFIPMLGIYNMPARSYKFTQGGAAAFFAQLMRDPDIMAGAYWNWSPDNGEAALMADGTSNNKFIEGLIWNKVIVIVPPVVPPVVIPPIDIPALLDMLVGYDYWEGNPDVDETVIAAIVKFMFIRLNDMNGGHHMDELFNKHWTEAANFLRCFYFVYNPWKDGMENFIWMTEHMPKDTPPRFMLDVEVKFSGYSASEYARQVDIFISKCISVGMLPVIYTGAWFIEYLSYWRKDVPYCWARYPLSMQPAATPGTFAQLQEKVNALKWDPDGSIAYPALAQNQRAPGEVKLWQVSEKWQLPGSGAHAIDIDIWNGTYEELVKWIKGTVIPPIVVPPVVDRLPAFLQKLHELEAEYA
jgi:GH25 family lysozyme M1 (1,4-beta-N-acetylmuramidase)